MDIATAEFFRKEREQCTTRDAKHVMPIKLIPDLEWEFFENIGVMESDKGVTIYCIIETENENEDTQVIKVSEPKTDVKTFENIEPVVTEAVEAPGATQTSEDTNTTETEEPRYEHRESSMIATEDAVPREKSESTEDAVLREKPETSKDADPRYEHRENSDTAMKDAVPREITKEAELTGNTGISQNNPIDQTEDTKVSEETAAEEIEMTDTIDVTEVITGIPEPTLEATSKESMTTPPGSPQREKLEVQNKNRHHTEVNAEQAVKKTHKYPKANNSIVNKIFSVFRQAKESIEAIPL